MPLTYRDSLVVVSLVGMIGQEVVEWNLLNSGLTSLQGESWIIAANSFQHHGTKTV
jgi:hypothetical protein